MGQYGSKLLPSSAKSASTPSQPTTPPQTSSVESSQHHLLSLGILDEEYLELDCVTKVLQTTELLEQILSHLPMRDLLHCQRTNATFRNVVQGSLQLKQKLFLEDTPSDTTLRLNPLITTFMQATLPYSVADLIDKHDTPSVYPRKALSFSDRVGTTYTDSHHFPYHANPTPYLDMKTGQHYLSWELKALEHKQTPSDTIFLDSMSSFYNMHLCQPSIPVRITIYSFDTVMQRDGTFAEEIVGHKRVAVRGGTLAEILAQIKEEKARPVSGESKKSFFERNRLREKVEAAVLRSGTIKRRRG